MMPSGMNGEPSGPEADPRTPARVEPEAGGDPSAASERDTDPEVRPGRFVDVLLVEDEADLRDGVRALLEDAGFLVVATRNGEEALSWLQSNPPPSVLLLDLVMPVMDGWQLCEAVRQDPVLAAIPRVVFSAMPPGSRQLARLGALATLAKPVDSPLLLETVRWLVHPRESIPAPG